MQTITRIDTVDESGFIHLNIEKPAGIKVRIIIEDMDSNATKLNISSENLALALMQEQSGFVKNVIVSSAEDLWNDL